MGKSHCEKAIASLESRIAEPQLQSPELSDREKGEILSELLVLTIHLHSHCDENLQNLISDEIEILADDI
jgi:hypothetical protein